MDGSKLKSTHAYKVSSCPAMYNKVDHSTAAPVSAKFPLDGQRVIPYIHVFFFYSRGFNDSE